MYFKSRQIKTSYYYIAVFFLLAIMFFNCVTAIREKSNTWDESGHLLAGYAFLKEGIDYLEPSHPPLARLFSALPLLFFNLESNLQSVLPPSILTGRESNFYTSSVKFLFENAVSGKKLLFWARIPNIILGIILGVYIFLWGKEVFGKKAALLSLCCYSFCPNILANAELITTDFPLTALFFIASYHLYKLSQKINLQRILTSGITLGFLFTIKYTGAFILPSILFLFIFLAIKESQYIIGCKKRVVYKYLSLLISILLIAYITIWGIYGFHYRTNIATAQWIELLYGQNNPLINIPILPESYIYGLTKLFQRSNDGHSAFLIGKYSTQGWWYYFIVAFMIKTPIPIIILLFFLLICYKKFPRKYPTIILSLLPIGIFFIITSTQHINIGIRHILPIYPFIYLLIGGLSSIKLHNLQLINFILTCLIIWHVYNAYSIYPHHLAFFNELIGGPKNGYKYLVDSNLDWGQDLPGLNKYMERKKISKINLSYFGCSNPSYYNIDYN